jgi:adenylate cyclase class 2
MAQETEIKLKIADVEAFRRALKRLGARPMLGGTGRVHETNLIFDTPQGGLAKHGQLLRIRTETPEVRGKKTARGAAPRVVLTFKSPAMREPGAAEKTEKLAAEIEKPGATDKLVAAGRHKVREEIEVVVADAGLLQKIFEGLGMRGWFRYEKYRTTFLLPAAARWAKGLLIEVDETPIGAFAELEGPPQAIDRAAKELGYSHRDYVLKNYLSLYVEECRQRGEEPRDMVFQKRR